ncbi:DUF3306 domain-containing protein [Roseivivax sp. CAU 1753]
MSRPRDFWSRRKAQVEAEAAEDARRADEVQRDARAQILAEQSDADILAQYGLPDPDSLMPGDGIAGFMRREIPDRLRRRAMRKLWRSNPVLACVDGLNDYDDDYSNAVTDMPGVRTAYQVGKGMKAHVEALAAEKRKTEAALAPVDDDAAAALPPEAATAEVSPGDRVADSVDDRFDDIGGGDHAATPIDERRQDAPEGTATTKVADVIDETSGTPLYTLDETMPRPRRMRFRFEETT